MCGVAGKISFRGDDVSSDSVERMLKKLSERGPDGDGLFKKSNFVFGHRRLKIIDLSEKAHQPMADHELGLVLTFNGCIYNYKELRKELESFGYHFFSTSDTEVILKAYHKWGEACVERLSGMFAFAIADLRDKSFFIARDRLGIKPLYYSDAPEGFLFASSLPALVASGEVGKEIDPEAIQFYLSFHSVVPAPLSVLRDVRKLPPGHFIKIEKTRSIRISRYWNLAYNRTKDEEKASLKVWKDKLEESLLTAVRRRTIADVPVGVLLSGGLDSSLIVALLHKLGQKDINTFSIGFESTGDEEGDEFRYSDIIASHFKTKHHKISISGSEMLTHLEDCVRSMSEPMVSHDNIGFYLLSREVSKHVKVVQSGQGADEVFAGYHWYPPLTESSASVDNYLQLFCDRTEDEMKEALSPKFSTAEIAREFVKAHFEQAGAKSTIDRALRLDTSVMLVEDPVKRVDNMTMRWGLEARVPFLDHDLVELAAKIPAHLKTPENGKYILKELSREYLPDAVIDRPKGYFPVPQLKYIRGETLDFVNAIWEKPEAKSRGLFNNSYVQKLLQKPEEHLTPLRGSKLWQISLLEYWFQCHDI